MVEEEEGEKRMHSRGEGEGQSEERVDRRVETGKGGGGRCNMYL